MGGSRPHDRQRSPQECLEGLARTHVGCDGSQRVLRLVFAEAEVAQREEQRGSLFGSRRVDDATIWAAVRVEEAQFARGPA